MLPIAIVVGCALASLAVSSFALIGFAIGFVIGRKTDITPTALLKEIMENM